MSILPISVSLHDFATHEGLFADLNPTAASWWSWNTLFKVLSGMKLNSKEGKFFSRVSGGVEYRAGKMPKNGLFIIGRKGGKTIKMSTIELYRSLTFDKKLAPGETARNLVVSPSHRNSTLTLDFCGGLIDSHEALKRHVVRRKMTEQLAEIRLDNQCSITAMPVNRVTGRGPSIYTLILDEAAFFKVEGQFSDEQIFNSCRPGMARFGDDAAYFIITSPGRKEGLVFDLYQRYFGKWNDEVLVINATSKQFNPTLTDEFLRKEEARDPDYYRREFLAQFVDAIFAAFGSEAVDLCVVSGRESLPFCSDFEYFGVVDPAGLSQNSEFNDEFAAGIAHIEQRPGAPRIGSLVGDIAPADQEQPAEHPVVVVDAVRAWSPDKSEPNFATPGQAIAEASEFFKAYGVETLIGDRYSGQWAEGQFVEAGFGFEVVDISKSDLYLEFVPAINNGEIELLDQKRANTQLKALERKRGPGGRDRIDHSKGRKDDRANVYALLNYVGKKRADSGAVSFSWV